MKCQNLSGKNKKNIINLSSAEYAHRMIKVKDFADLLIDILRVLELTFSYSYI